MKKLIFLSLVICLIQCLTIFQCSATFADRSYLVPIIQRSKAFLKPLDGLGTFIKRTESCKGRGSFNNDDPLVLCGQLLEPGAVFALRQGRMYPNVACAKDGRIEKLFDAVQLGKLTQVKQLIADGVPCSVRGSTDATLLMTACLHLQVEVVDYLLSCSGIEVNACNSLGYTALHFAVHSGIKLDKTIEATAIIALLKNGGIDFEYKPAHEGARTALEIAVSRYPISPRVALIVTNVLLDCSAKPQVSRIYKEKFLMMQQQLACMRRVPLLKFSKLEITTGVNS